MTTVELKSSAPCGEGLRHLVFRAPEALLRSHARPGQHVRLESGGQSGVFALACMPGTERLEFLVKNAEGAAAALCALKSGDTADCSEAQGSGFPFEKGNDLHVHMFSMGSGLAPFRSLIQWRLAGNFAPKSFTLWQGSFTGGHLPFAGEYSDWEKSGLAIYRCLDKAKNIANGNVLQVLARKKPDMSQAACYWAGSKEFGRDLESILSGLGLPANMLFANF